MDTRHGPLTAGSVATGESMIGRLNHVAIAVPSLAGGRGAVSRHAGRGGVRAAAAARARRHRGVRQPAQHQDRAAGAAGREVADRRVPGAQPGRRHPSHLLRGRRHHRRARQAQGRRARACWATASPRSARTASRCCSCIPRTSTARWSSWSRPERHERPVRHRHLRRHLVDGAVRHPADRRAHAGRGRRDRARHAGERADARRGCCASCC